MAKTIAEHEIKFLLSAKNTTGTAFKKILKNLPSMKSLALAAGKAIAAIGIAASVAMSTAVVKFADFETALTDMTRVTEQSLADIKDQMADLPPELGGATELVKGYYNVISSGVTQPKAALDLLTVAAKASKSAHIELDTTVSGITDVMDGFGGSIESATVASDKLFTIERIGKTRFSELVPVVGQVSSAANLLGVNIDELGGLFATVTKTAGGTQNAATQVKAIFSALLKPSADMASTLDRLGYDSGRAAIESLGLVGTMKELKDEVDRGNVSFTDLFANQRAIVGLGPAMQDSFQTLGKNIVEMADSAGVTEEAFDAWSQTLEGLWDTFKNTVGNLAIEIGSRVAPDVQKALMDINFWFQDNEEQILHWVDVSIEQWGRLKVGTAKLITDIVTSYEEFEKKIRPTVDAIADVVVGFIDGITGRNLDRGVDRFAPFAERLGQFVRTITLAFADALIKILEWEAAIEKIKVNFFNWVRDVLSAVGTFVETWVERFEDLTFLIDFVKALFSADEVGKEAAKVTDELASVTGAALEMQRTVNESDLEININTDPAEESVEIIKAGLGSIPETTTVEALVENIDALASIAAVVTAQENIEDVTSKVNMETLEAHAAIEAVQNHMDAIPDITVKTLVMKVVTEASPQRPFSEGMKYIKEKIEGLPGRRGLVIDTELPNAGRGIEPDLLLASSGGSGGGFVPGSNRGATTVQNTTNQNIDLTVNITTQKIDDRSIDSFTDKISESLARKLNTGRVINLRNAIRSTV